MTQEQERETLLEFPNRFPLKIFGLDNEVFTAAIKTIIERHVDLADQLNWQQNLSKKGTYLAVTVTIMARSQAQLDAIYNDLTREDSVKMAL